jgi:hypothetical protein
MAIDNSVLADFEGTGASAKTAAQDRLAPGRQASLTMARTDLPRVQRLKDRFNENAAATGLPPAVLAAIASRESRCGNVLDRNGYGDGGQAFGIMQVDKRYHELDGLPDPTSQDHISQAAGILANNLATIAAQPSFAGQPASRQLQGAIAAYNCGCADVSDPDTADEHTTGHDYSNDVWERAKFYAMGW